VLLSVLFCGFFRMMGGVQMVTVRNVGMMPCLFMVPLRVVFGRLFVVLRRVLMMLRSFSMMVCTLLAHIKGIEDFGFGWLSCKTSNLSVTSRGSL
jgi:hypothetical protein